MECAFICLCDFVFLYWRFSGFLATAKNMKSYLPHFFFYLSVSVRANNQVTFVSCPHDEIDNYITKRTINMILDHMCSQCLWWGSLPSYLFLKRNIYLTAVFVIGKDEANKDITSRQMTPERRRKHQFLAISSVCFLRSNFHLIWTITSNRTNNLKR